VRGHSEEGERSLLWAIKKDVLDELLAGAEGKDVFGKNGLFDELKKALAERMLNAEMDHYLTQEAAEPGRNCANHRNGYSKKTVLTDAAKIEIAVPRDRAGTFDPQLIAKYQRRFPGFDEKIVSMHARGMRVNPALNTKLLTLPTSRSSGYRHRKPLTRHPEADARRPPCAHRLKRFTQVVCGP
jgi:hypothetical protein